LELTELDLLLMALLLLMAMAFLIGGIAVHLYWVDKENKRLKKELEEKQRATQA